MAEGLMTRPDITVVLPTHNGERFLDSAIGSIVAQCCEAWELIVVDDGSTDTTPTLVASWVEKDPRIRSIRLAPNRGLPIALNAGFARAAGTYFTWTSDDNAYAPDAFERLLEAMRSPDRPDLVWSGYTEIDESGTPLRERDAGSAEDLLLANTIGACFLYRREVDTALGGYDTNLPLAEDYDFWLRASRSFRLQPIHGSLYEYRVHADSLTSQHRSGVEAAAARALACHLQALDRRERAAAFVRLGAADLAHGRIERGRQRLRRAIRLGRIPLVHRGFRWVLLDWLIAPGLASRVRARDLRRPSRVSP